MTFRSELYQLWTELIIMLNHEQNRGSIRYKRWNRTITISTKWEHIINDPFLYTNIFSMSENRWNITLKYYWICWAHLFIACSLFTLSRLLFQDVLRSMLHGGEVKFTPRWVFFWDTRTFHLRLKTENFHPGVKWIFWPFCMIFQMFSFSKIQIFW